jgi:hypothetical protein
VDISIKSVDNFFQLFQRYVNSVDIQELFVDNNGRNVDNFKKSVDILKYIPSYLQPPKYLHKLEERKND